MAHGKRGSETAVVAFADVHPRAIATAGRKAEEFASCPALGCRRERGQCQRGMCHAVRCS
eukprot:7175357-Alexandrium_andersonii.AAC.1